MANKIAACGRVGAGILGILLTLCGVARGQSYAIAPTPFQTVLDDNGIIVNNGCIWTYQAGTTTAIATYSNNTGTPNLNPIRTGTSGRFTAYLLAGTGYKFVYESSCTPPAHGTVYRTADNISGVPASSATVDITATAGETITALQAVYFSDGSGGKVAGQVYKADPVNTYSSTGTLVGVAPSSIVSGATGTVRLQGQVTGFTSLSVGALYYASTAGAITATVPTANAFVLGQADSATTLNLGRALVPLLVGNNTWGGRQDLLTYTETFTQPTIATNVLTVNLALGSQFYVALTANITTLTVSNIPAGATRAVALTLVFIADGSLRTIAWPAAFKFPGGVAPTMTSTNTKADIIQCVTYTTGGAWFCTVAGQNF